MNLQAWERELAAVMPFVIEVRRQLHRHPEVGGKEQWTRAYLEGTLADMGLASHRFEGTCGLAACIEGARPGPCLAFCLGVERKHACLRP